MDDETLRAKKLRNAEELAFNLIRDHGLDSLGWQFEWSRGKKQLGCAQIKHAETKSGQLIQKKSIRLSKYLVELNSLEVVREVILHEIAHALVGLHNGHNEMWRNMCKKIGAKPERLADQSTSVIAARYIIQCPKCNRNIGSRHRRMSEKRLRELYCAECGVRTAGTLKIFDTQR